MTAKTDAAPGLLPCPFCGCTTVLQKKNPVYGFTFHECDWCGAEGPAEAPNEDPPATWNTRAASPESLARQPEVQVLIAAERESIALMVERAPVTFKAQSGAMNARDTLDFIAAAIRNRSSKP